MKVLLAAVNAKYIHSNLAVYSLKSFATEYAREIHITEYTINQRIDDILADLYRQKPDILCFSCYLWNISYVKQIVVEIKKGTARHTYLAWRSGGFLQCGADAGLLSTAGWYYARGRGRNISGTASLLSL